MNYSPLEESLENFVKRRQIELALTLEGKKAIYLDLKFWIILRNAAANKHTDYQEIKLLELLKEQVANGKVFCPISESTFTEIFKQRDAFTRLATAQLVDDLSLGVALIPFDLRINTELAHFVYSFRMPNAVHPLNHLVWTKLSSVLGNTYFTNTALETKTELELQKSFFDYLWTIPLSKIVDMIDDKAPPPVNYEKLSADLNASNKQYSAELRSFEQTYALEIKGAVELYAEVVAEIFNKIAEKETSEKVIKGSAQWLELELQCKNLLIGAFKKDATKDALRTLHIYTCIYALVRWNRSQQIKVNDFFDFHHASAALGYCDAFFTERSLHAMITSNKIALDKRYSCLVVATVSEAIEFLKTLS